MTTNQGVIAIGLEAIVTGGENTLRPDLSMRVETLNTCDAQPWFADGLNLDSSGEISITVQVEGVVQAGMRVRLVHRKTHVTIGDSHTASDGTITFKNLNRDATGDYYAIAFSEEDYNALIYDKLTPV